MLDPIIYKNKEVLVQSCETAKQLCVNQIAQYKDLLEVADTEEKKKRYLEMIDAGEVSLTRYARLQEKVRDHAEDLTPLDLNFLCITVECAREVISRSIENMKKMTIELGRLSEYCLNLGQKKD